MFEPKTDSGNLLTVPSLDKFTENANDSFPGEIIFGSGKISLNIGRNAVVLKVINKADRPVQVNTLNFKVFIL